MGFISDLLGTSSNPQNIQTSNYSPYVQKGMDAQSQLLQSLQAMSQGQGPNLGQTQLQAAQNQNAQQAAGMIGSQKGINPGLAARQILQNYGMANQNAANQSAQLQQQQQLGALGMEGQVANQLGQGAGQLQNQQNAAQFQNSQFNAKQGGGILGGILSGVGAATGLGALGAAGAALAEGGMVKGQEQVPGDSPENDTVPAMLSAGEIVIPKEVVEGRPEDASKFIEAIKAHKDDGNPQGYAKVLAAHRHLHERVSALESLSKGKK